MKKIFAQKLSIVFSFITLLMVTGGLACIDYSYDWEGYDSNFAPEVFIENNTYKSLYVLNDSRSFYYHDQQIFDDENAKDWSKYLEKKVDLKTLKFFLATDSSRTDLGAINNYLKYNKHNSLSKKWQSKLDFKNPKVKKFLTFLNLAKSIENATTLNGNWDYENFVNPNKVDAKTIAEIGNRYTNETDSFLRNRYWFQSIKAIFYSNFSNQLTNFFNKTEKTQPKNTLYYRAIAYLAGVNYKKKNFTLSNYQYSIVFDKCSTMRTVASYCFHPENQTDWEKSLQMAKSNEEKIALWAVAGYYRNEIEAVQKIYELNPKSHHLDYLLTRLVNIQERFTIMDSKRKIYSVKDSLNTNAFDLVIKIAKEAKTEKQFMWNCAAGYFQILAQKYDDADSYFDKAETMMPNTSLAKDQMRLFRFINKLSKISKLKKNSEESLVADLNWLNFQLNDEVLRFQNARDWSKKYISSMYQNQNNIVMAELFAPDEKFSLKNENIEAMKAFMRKSNKTEIEKIGLKLYPLKLEDLLHQQAVMAAFNNKIDQTIDYLQQSDSIKKVTFKCNPFNGKIKDCNSCEAQIKLKKTYTYLEFFQNIKTMQDNLKNEIDTYNNALLLGNAFYNITHFGASRGFHQTRIIGYHDNPYYEEPYQSYIIDCSTAKSYYEKAFASATNDELRAKCQYLLAKCERNKYYIDLLSKRDNSVFRWGYNDTIKYVSWNGFKMLKNNYAHTNYYKEVIRDCGYFDVYVNGPRQN